MPNQQKVVVIPSSSQSMTTTAQIAAKVVKNRVSITSPSHVYGFFVKDRIMLTVNHIFADPKAPISFRTHEGKLFTYAQYDSTQYPDFDLNVIVFPQKSANGEHLDSFPDITNHFIDANSIGTVENLVRVEENGTLTSNIKVSGPAITAVYQSPRGLLSVPMTLTLKIASLAGDCGLLYFDEITSKICAYHIAGDEINTGYARILTADYLDFLLRSVTFATAQSREIVQADIDDGAHTNNPIYKFCRSRITSVQHWTKDDKVVHLTHVPTKSSLKPNPHWINPEDVPEIPAALSITYGISPLDEGFKRIGENPATPNLDTALLDICIDLVRKKIGLDKIQCKVLNLSEALNGIRGFAPMRHDSADGLPASLDKAKLFTVSPTGVREPTPELYAYTNSLLKEEFEKFPFTATLKDELLPRRKVSPELIKTRIFFLRSQMPKHRP